MKGFWFSKSDKRLRYKDERLAEVDTTHEVVNELKLCQYGLHGCETLLDALKFAPGNILWHCEYGDVIKGEDKFVARSRTYLAEFDAAELLKEFARRCVLRVIHLAEHCFAAPEEYQVVIKFLETGEDALLDEAIIDKVIDASALDTLGVYYALEAVIFARNMVTSTVVDAADNAALAAANAVLAGDPENAQAEREWQNETLTQMVREATGWEI